MWARSSVSQQPRAPLTTSSAAQRASRMRGARRAATSLAEKLLQAFRASVPAGQLPGAAGGGLLQPRARGTLAPKATAAEPVPPAPARQQAQGGNGQASWQAAALQRVRKQSAANNLAPKPVGMARRRAQRHLAQAGQPNGSAPQQVLQPLHPPPPAHAQQAGSSSAAVVTQPAASPGAPVPLAQPAAAAPLQEGQQPAAPWPGGPAIAPAAAPAEGAAPLQQQPPLQPPPAPAHAAAEEPMAAAAALSSMDPEELPEEVVQQAIPNEPPPDVHIVASAAEARRVASALLALPPAELEGMVFGCDTEVMDIDISAHSPCCHGRVICLSIYCGPERHWGPEEAQETKRSMIWVDTYLEGAEERQEEAAEIIEAFRPFFESAAHCKVWHNYSFDRHVLERLGYSMAGFAADTMHMARLWDSSRVGAKGGYSLETLSGSPEIMGDQEGGEVRGKVSMKKLFSRRKVKKDGTEGKQFELPPMEQLQVDPETKWRWVNYSAYDAKATWDLYGALKEKLQAMRISRQVDSHVAADFATAGVRLGTMWDVYTRVLVPFGKLLTDMEAAGMAVDREHLAGAQQRAEAEQAEAMERFRAWAAAAVPDAQWMNVSSGAQVLQLLFAGCPNKNKGKDGVPLERVFKVPNTTGFIEEGAKRAKKNRDIRLHSVWGPNERSPLVPEIHTPSGAPACNTAVIKQLAGKAGKARKALAELEAKPDTGFERDDAWLEAGDGEDTAAEPLFELDEDGSTWSTEDASITEKQQELQEAVRPRTQKELEDEAKEKGYGKLYAHFGTAERGLRACSAVDALVDVSAIDTLLSNFIIPLQSDAISKPDAAGVPRVHCSLNINTETGRLSARRPNLQNQPALEKDRYKVRKAFTADVAAGKTLVVADYGQLELRILAHMAKCKSMITAFEAGGDFHSRTALGMYDHIKEAIAAGKCLLEWDGGESGDEPSPVPLLKDMFASERRKAKVLNFSIAYGKTAHGLQKDWGVTLEEAQDTVKRWYSDRPEVEKWQEQRRAEAMSKGYVCTLLGRRRQLPDAQATSSASKAHRAHALRAAINTPIQGSAADVAMAAMLRIDNDPELRELGYRLLLQVHDEVILEGPKEHAEAARRRVIECMRSPFSGASEKPLLVDLVVDCKFADTWYEAK